MQTWTITFAAASLAAFALATGCGDGDSGDDDDASGGRTAATGGRTSQGGNEAIGGATECNVVRNFVPSTEDDDPGPACQDYADCMSAGCGAIYEDAFGADWASGDLSGGACGPSVPCLEGCGCDTTCLTGCITADLACTSYAVQLQNCYVACEESFLACEEERAP